MAEVLLKFDADIRDSRGLGYTARVCGREAEDGLWEGWIEFHPQDGGAVLRTPRETDQPNRSDLEYWATGLTLPYLEGALQRALRPETPDLRPRTIAVRPAYDRPAPGAAEAQGEPTPNQIRPRAVIDPFEVFGQGEHVLRQELSALEEGHLRNLVKAYDLGDEEEALQAIDRATLIEMIVAAVRQRAG